MELSFSYFLSQMRGNPLLTLSFVLTLGVILVNGWTDAPNAIATTVVTRCMGVRQAILMAAVFNFLGVFVMSLVNAAVVGTITNMVDFGTDSHEAVVALSGALLSIVIWATAAWAFGIPTSESHALIAGLTGGAVALHGGLDGVNGGEWIKVLYGLFLSVLLGFFTGYLICKLVISLFRGADRRKTEKLFRYAQIAGSAAMSFMHGAQDGQKFMGVILLSLILVNGGRGGGRVQLPLWLMLLCSAVMALGTLIGGKKIIRAVGMDMVKIEKYQGFSADIAASLCLLISTVFGLPVSTTHAKTAAIMGVGGVKSIRKINFSVVKEMMLAWVLTFPGCGLIGYAVTKLFIYLF